MPTESKERKDLVWIVTCLFLMLTLAIILRVFIRTEAGLLVILGFYLTIIFKLRNAHKTLKNRVFDSFRVNRHKKVRDKRQRTVSEHTSLPSYPPFELEKEKINYEYYANTYNNEVNAHKANNNGRKPLSNLIATLIFICVIILPLSTIAVTIDSLSYFLPTPTHQEVVEDLPTDAPQEEAKDSSSFRNTDIYYPLPTDVTEIRDIRSLTEYEIHLLQVLIHRKAVGEDEKGRILIANVIFNRLDSPNHPNTIACVVFENGAFAITEHDDFDTVTPDNHTMTAINSAINGADYSLGATHFRSLHGITPYVWHEAAVRNGRLTHLFDHGDHRFYREVLSTP